MLHQPTVSQKQLLEMRNEKLAIEKSTQFITLPTNFCKIIATTNELIDKEVAAKNYDFKRNSR